jgi:uncharacterized protein YkwD
VAHFALALLVGLPIGGASVPRTGAAVNPAEGPCPAGQALDVVARANAYRQARGLAPLEPDARLFVAAERLAADLAAHGTIGHVGSDGSLPWTRVDAAGYTRTMVAENVAAGQTDAAQAVRGWIDSPPHRANLLQAGVRHVGAAHVVGRPACRGCAPHYWVLVLADTRGPAVSVPPACATLVAAR